jgi:hypothetical protein
MFCYPETVISPRFCQLCEAQRAGKRNSGGFSFPYGAFVENTQAI